MKLPIWLSSSIASLVILSWPAPPVEAEPCCAHSVLQSRKKKSKKEQKAPKPERMDYWIGDLDAARKNAQERGVPVLILAILHEEEASDRFAEQIYDNKALAEATQNAIVVLVNNGTHALRERTFRENGEKVTREVCEMFGTKNCSVHQKNWDAVYRDYVLAFDPEGDWHLPEAIVLDPQLEIDDRIGEGHPPEDSAITSSLRSIVKKFGEGLTSEGLRTVKAAGEQAKKLGRMEKWAQAWREWQKVLDLTTTGPFGEEASAGQVAVLGKMRERMDAIVALLTPDTIRDGFQQLLATETDYAGTALAGPIADTIKRAEMDKRFNQAIGQTRTEQKAAGIWAEAQELLRSGERKKALRVAKKLLGRKYKETPSAAEALKTFPELAGDG